ncbi:glycosyltransferase family 2 protein [Cellulophaga sp. Asnod2-G02]|uniref:glycosyltransferase family 2 protein n=1 Tax=Cellulophaga sp. Asnod2-G02 TaxID=3160572 RepID=UPI003867B14F
MINRKKVCVVLPAYNAEKTLRQTYIEIPREIVDYVILTDDGSIDNTLGVAKELGIEFIIEHKSNLGYGANQKSCYKKALELNSDIIIMLHPDYQYTPNLILPMTHLISSRLYDVVLGSRILGKGALEGGMPLYKYLANRILTLFQNILLNHKLSEYHTGYRAYSKEVLNQIDFERFSNDFIFDNQILIATIKNNFKIGEISCPTRYDSNSSSINFKRSVSYGCKVIYESVKYILTSYILLFLLLN